MSFESALESLVRSIVGAGEETMRALASGGLAHDFARRWPSQAEYREAVQTAGRDGGLQPLLARTDGNSPTVSSIAFAAPVRAVLLPAGVIASAVLELLARGEPLTTESVLPIAQRNVASMRLIAAGETIEVLTVVGLTGFILADGTILETAAGTIRPADSCQAPGVAQARQGFASQSLRGRGTARLPHQLP